MVVQESNLGEDHMQEISTYEDEETLSLSDLPLYSHVEWEEDEAALSSSDQDYFEFNFSQELSPSAVTTPAFSPPENVFFCGKLIPYKQPSHHHVSDKESVKKQVADGDRKDHRSSLQRSDFRLFKMSILASSSSGKARWHLFFFGLRSFSTKMELRDIRSRQNRRRCSSPPLLPSSGDHVVGQGRNRGWGFWAVIRALSCGGNHHARPQ